MKFGLLLLLLSACSFDEMSSAPDAHTNLGAPDAAPRPDAALPPDASAPDAAMPDGKIDLDNDGLDDRDEDRIAREYLPFLSIDPQDGCPLAGILFRLRPHPMAPTTRLHMIACVIYQSDCGSLGHAGDDEVFGVTIDPSRPAPAGILAVRAIAHQGTLCEHTSECGTCSGMSACTTAMRNGAAYPVVFPSKDKHGNYMSTSDCNGACFFSNSCTLAPMPAEPPLQNAGEPGAPLTRNLTTTGFITAQNGWTDSSLMGFDPWGNTNFGGAGNVTSDLTDDSFLTPICQ
jgi:hypothetical protein